MNNDSKWLCIVAFSLSVCAPVATKVQIMFTADAPAIQRIICMISGVNDAAA